MSLQEISNSINVIKDFPEKGIYFRDIAGLLINPELYDAATNMMVDLVKNERIDYVMGFESRGFIFGQTIASKLNKGFCMLRKPNATPNEIQVKYGYEKDDSILTVQGGLIPQGSHILLVDDLLATGGSLLAGCNLMKLINCHVSACVCLIELVGLQKQKELDEYKICSVIKYPANRGDKFISKSEELLFRKPIEYTPTMGNIKENQSIDNRIVVFSHPSMKEIADNIVMFSKYFREGGITWSHSSDNYPLITFDDLKYLINKRIVFVGSLYNRANFSEQLSLLTRLPKGTVKSLDVIIPYFAPGINNSISNSGENQLTANNYLSTAKSYAKIVSNCLVTTQDGPPRIHIYDSHTSDIDSWFSDAAVVNLDTAVGLVKEKINRDTTTIVFPNQSTQNRYFEQFQDFRIYNVDTKKTINWPSPGYDDKCMDNILIVDDWVQSGDVLEKCRLEMISKGANIINAYVTHAVFPNGSHKNAMFENFNKIYVTNSIPEVTTKLIGKHPFEVLKLDGLIRDKLLQLFEIRPSEMMVPKQYNVYVASENQTKLSATYDAINHVLKSCELDDFNLKVYGVDVPSNVPNQPVNEETITGCQNRLDCLMKYVETKQLDCDFFVSIESGAFYDGELNSSTIIRDHCQVSIIAKSDKHTAQCQKLSNQFTVCPTNFMFESIKSNKTQTIGKLIEKAYGYKTETWHMHFGDKITRHEMIFNTIVELFGSAFGVDNVGESVGESVVE